MYSEKVCSLVASLFCFALCAWQSGQVKLNLDMLKAASPSTLHPDPAHPDKSEAEDAVSGNIAAAVLFGIAGALAFGGLFMSSKQKQY